LLARAGMSISTDAPPKPNPKRTIPEPEPDFAEEAAPKESEFKDAKDAKQFTNPEFEIVP